jgi:hypothetical protein
MKDGSANSVPFEIWREQLLADAQRCGRRHNAEQLTDDVLRLFWEGGAAPTVVALIRSGEAAGRAGEKAKAS